MLYRLKRKNQGVVAANDWLKWYVDMIMRELHINQGKYFAYAVEKNGLYNELTPWKRRSDGLWRITEWERSYFRDLGAFLNISAGEGFQFKPCVYPGKYGEIPWMENAEGYRGYLDSRARGRQNHFLNRIVSGLINHQQSRGMTIELEFSNEMKHRDHRHGVEIAKLHGDWYKSIKDRLPIDQVVSNCAESDFTHGDLVELHYVLEGFNVVSIEKYNQLPDPKPEIIDTLGDDSFGRKIWFQLHNINMVTLERPTEPGSDKTLWDSIKGNRAKKFYFSQDGNRYGLGYPVPGTPFIGLSKEEMYDLYSFFFTQSKDLGKRFRGCVFPMEIFQKNNKGILIDKPANIQDCLEIYRQPYNA
jgi:hypothetical protein